MLKTDLLCLCQSGWVFALELVCSLVSYSIHTKKFSTIIFFVSPASVLVDMIGEASLPSIEWSVVEEEEPG